MSSWVDGWTNDNEGGELVFMHLSLGLESYFLFHNMTYLP